MSLLTKGTSAESAQAYYEMEGNCNTCKHLERVAHAKSWVGFLHGRCPKSGGAVMTFHPHDPMHMDCYEDRRTGNRCTVAIWREQARVNQLVQVITDQIDRDVLTLIRSRSEASLMADLPKT